MAKLAPNEDTAHDVMLSVAIFIGTLGLLHLLVATAESARTQARPCTVQRRTRGEACECHKRSP